MNFWESYFSTLFTHAGFSDFRIEVTDETHHSGVIFLYDAFFETYPDELGRFVETIAHLVQLVAKKNAIQPIFFDVNNYRHKRHELIGELARAAARKALSTRGSVSLPPMNSYERRIVHTELAAHPTIATESIGEGKERHVVLKPTD